ncbi:RHS repeat protein, partial [Roseimaritima sediminicola]|uniref:RHS repeat protein n=1 Tax=Roseimaritima sediminicola TaxID=2662066 RepID=UPI0013876847
MRTIIGDVPTQNTRYWAVGSVRSATDQLGNVARFDYDQRGRLSTAYQPRPEASVVSPEVGYQYTVDGLLTAVTDPLGRVTSYSYDDGGRVTRVTQPDPDGAGSLAAAYTDYVYDSLGNTVSTSDALGQTNAVERDAWYRVIASTDPSSATTSTRYDVFGNIVNVTDPLGNETVYTYNRLNQLVTEGKVYGSGTQNRSYAYDGAGNLRSLVDRNDRRTEWAYDNRYRVSSETWKTGASVDRTLTYAYDTSDRTTSIDDSDPLATDFDFSYDDRSQLLAERQLISLVGTSVALNRAFDDNGNRITLGANFGGTLAGTSIVGGVDDFTRQFTYDGLGRLTSVNSDAVSGGHAVAPQLVTFEYNAASQRTDLRRYSATTADPSDLQVHSRRGYDQAGRLASITHGTAEIAAGETWDGTSSLPASLGSSNMLAGYFFGYDQDNRLVEFASYRDGTETSYGYDSRDQLTSATTAAIAGLSQPFGLASSESYDFDAGGNRKSSGGSSQSATDTHNQLQTDGTYNYTYDDEGNTLSKTSIATGEVTEYAWDHRNRLVLVTERASAGGTITQQVEFIYDAFDQRVGKRVDSDGDGTWDRDEAFVWADGQTMLRFVDSDGEAVSESFRVANRYLYGDVVDEVLADEQYAAGSGPAVNSSTASTTAGETLWTIADHLGSVRDLVDDNGVVRQHVVYDSFGNRLVEQDYDASGTAIASSHASAVDTLFGYTGRDWDADVELQNNRARWYDPTTGRWLSQDPIGFAAGDANLYRYVGNGPTTRIDPSGLQEPTDGPTIGAHPNPTPVWQEPFVYDPRDPDVLYKPGMLGWTVSNLYHRLGFAGAVNGVRGNLSLWYNDPGEAAMNCTGPGFMYNFFADGGPEAIASMSDLEKQDIPVQVATGIVTGNILGNVTGVLPVRVSRSGYKFRIISREGKVLEIAGEGPEGRLYSIPEVIDQGDTVCLRGFDIDGPGAGSFSRYELKLLVRDLVEQLGYKPSKIRIEGNPRTTGANPGKQP